MFEFELSERDIREIEEINGLYEENMCEICKEEINNTEFLLNNGVHDECLKSDFDFENISASGVHS